MLKRVGELGVEEVGECGGGGEGLRVTGDEGELWEESWASSGCFVVCGLEAESEEVFLLAQLKCFGSWAKWMERPRRVSKLRPHEHRNGDFKAGGVLLLPFTFIDAMGDISVPLGVDDTSVSLEVTESLGVNLDSLGVTEVELEPLVAIGAETGITALMESDEMGSPSLVAALPTSGFSISSAVPDEASS